MILSPVTELKNKIIRAGNPYICLYKNKIMFIISLTYKKPIEEVDKLLPGHYIYIDKYVRESLS